MPSFFDRIAESLQRIYERLTGGGGQPPPPEPEGTEEEEIQEREIGPGEEEVTVQENQSGCTVEYNPGRKEGKHIRVYPRWYTDYPDMDCIRELFRQSGTKQVYAIVICGTPCNEYTGKEGEEQICLSFKIEDRNLRQILSDPNVQSATDFANDVNSLYPNLDCWTSEDQGGEITQISVLDTFF